MKNEEYLTAIHEIGHCIAYSEFNIPFEYVAIISNDGSLGHVSPYYSYLNIDIYESREYEDFYFDFNSCLIQKKIEADIIIFISGDVAQNKYLDKEIEISGSDFRETMEDLYKIFGDDEKIITNYLNFLCSISRNIIDKRWDLILLLADILMEKKTLLYSDYLQEKSEYFSIKLKNR
jgi:hypothetical protein